MCGQIVSYCSSWVQSGIMSNTTKGANSTSAQTGRSTSTSQMKVDILLDKKKNLPPRNWWEASSHEANALFVQVRDRKDAIECSARLCHHLQTALVKFTMLRRG